MAKTKYVYFFGNGDAEGDETMRPILGGKGANLAQMAKAPLSLPVPPGWKTHACCTGSPDSLPAGAGI